MLRSGNGNRFNLLFVGFLNQNNDIRKVKVLPCGNGKAKMFGVGILKFIDTYSFMIMSLDKMAKVIICKKRLYIRMIRLKMTPCKIA